MSLRKLTPYISATSFVAKAPGRINLLGEHTDYNDGFVLPAAIDRAVYVSITPRKDREIHLHSLDLKQSIKLRADQICIVKEKWANYVLGVIAQFSRLEAEIPGFDLHFTGDLPLGGGLSSSAAVECSVATALNEMLELKIDRLELSRMCQHAEHQYAGVMCGIMDQFASLFGKKDHLIRLDCRSLEYEYIPFKLDGMKILLFDTNIKHSLATSEYNIRRQQCLNAVAKIARHYPEVKSLRDATLPMLEEVLRTDNKILYLRSKYVVEENERLLKGCEDLKNNNLVSFGEKMFITHAGLSQMYDVSCAELDFLVNEVQRFPDVIGARMMGGGFGGCTINLIREAAATDVTDYLKKRYKDVMKRELGVHDVRIDNGSTIIRHFTNEAVHETQ